LGRRHEARDGSDAPSKSFINETRGDPRLDVRALTKRDFETFGLAQPLEYTYSHGWSNTPFDA
jgi:hypothetical protein